MQRRHIKYHAVKQKWRCADCNNHLKPGYELCANGVVCNDCTALVCCPVESLKVGKRDVSFALKSYIAHRDRYECCACHTLVGLAYEIDHVKPLHMKGSNLASNLELLCNSCHASKSYLEQLGVVAKGDEMVSIYFA